MKIHALTMAMVLGMLGACPADDDDTGAETGGDASADSGSGTGGMSTAATTAGTTTADTGTATGGAGDCPSCVECTNMNCGDQLDACDADAECLAIHQCAEACMPDGVEPCIEAHTQGVALWSGVSQCINNNCLAPCTY